MSISVDIRSFKNPADKARKENDYKEYLKLQQKLNQQSEEANKAYAKGQVMGLQPQGPTKKYASAEEAQADIASQKEQALKNLRTILPYGNDALEAVNWFNAVRPIGSRGSELNVFNQSWGDFSSELKGQTNISLDYFKQLWRRYGQKIAKTNLTGIQIPIDDTGFNEGLRNMRTTIIQEMRNQGMLTNRKMQQVQEAIDVSVAERNQVMLEKIKRAIFTENVEQLDSLLRQIKPDLEKINVGVTKLDELREWASIQFDEQRIRSMSAEEIAKQIRRINPEQELPANVRQNKERVVQIMLGLMNEIKYAEQLSKDEQEWLQGLEKEREKALVRQLERPEKQDVISIARLRGMAETEARREKKIAKEEEKATAMYKRMATQERKRGVAERKKEKAQRISMEEADRQSRKVEELIKYRPERAFSLKQKTAIAFIQNQLRKLQPAFNSYVYHINDYDMAGEPVPDELAEKYLEVRDKINELEARLQRIKSGEKVITQRKKGAVVSEFKTKIGQSREEIQQEIKQLTEEVNDLNEEAYFNYQLVGEEVPLAIRNEIFKREGLIKDLKDILENYVGGTGISKSKNTGMTKISRGMKVICGRGIKSSDEEKYNQFGRYIIHMPSLKNNKLNLKYPSLGYIPNMPITHISDDMKEFIMDLLDTERITPHLYNKLSKDDKKFFDRVAEQSKIDDALGIKIDDLEKREQMKRFEILRGQMVAGNDNEDLRKELKRYLIQFMNEGIIPRKEATNILVELMAMG